MPSRLEILHIVRMGVRRAVSLAAIYAVALHTILLGIVPVSAGVQARVIRSLSSAIVTPRR